MKKPLLPLGFLLAITPMLLGDRGILPQYAPPEAYLPGETLPYFGSENPWDRRFFASADVDQGRFGQREMIDITEGRVDAAIAACRLRLAGNPADLEARFALLVGLVQDGNLAEAEGELNALLDRGLPVTRLLAGPRPLLAPLRDTPTFQTRVVGQTHGLVHGPLLGAVTPTSARFWVRTEQAADVEVRLSRTGRFDQPDAVGQARSDASRDFTAVIAVDGLEPASSYDYALLIDGQPVPRWSQWSFRTFVPANDPRPVRIAFGGCAAYVPENERMWDVIALRRPDAFLLLGDNVYIDLPEIAGPFHDYTYYCRQSRPEFRRLVAGTPVYAIWDDHDAGTDDIFLGPYPDKPAWKPTFLDLFRRNWNNPSYGAEPARPGVWFNFRIGQVEVFMLDGRYYRENWLQPHPSMLGPVQLAWLKEALQHSTATFKILVSSTPWATDAKLETDPATGKIIQANDDWNGFPEERAGIYDFLAGHQINGVLLLSGDRHRADLRLNPRARGYPLHELMCSRLTMLKATSPSGKPLWLYDQGCSFAVLNIDPGAPDPTLTMEVATIEGEPVLKRTLHLSEMSDR